MNEQASKWKSTIWHQRKAREANLVRFYTGAFNKGGVSVYWFQTCSLSQACDVKRGEGETGSTFVL